MRTSAPRLSRLLAGGIGVLMTATGLACSSAQPAAVSPLRSAAAHPAASARPTPSPSPTTAMIMGTKWTQVWNDTFSGPAGQGVSTANWRYETGQGTFGTGEVERMTDSTANVHTDGQGNLDIAPLPARSMDLRPDCDDPRFCRSRRRRDDDHRLDHAAQPGQRDRLLARLLAHRPAGTVAGTGEIDIMEDVNAAREVAGTLHCGNLTEHNADGTTGPCHEGTGLTSQLRPCPECQSSLQHLQPGHRPAERGRRVSLLVHRR